MALSIFATIIAVLLLWQLLTTAAVLDDSPWLLNRGQRKRWKYIHSGATVAAALLLILFAWSS